MMIFTEIEAIVINQPLTYVSDNPDDLEPLKSSPARQTVSMQLLKKAMGTYQVIEDGKKRVAVSNQLWKRCLIKYLLTIQSRHKWNVNQTNIEPGTMVLLKQENLPWGQENTFDQQWRFSSGMWQQFWHSSKSGALETVTLKPSIYDF